MENKTMFHGSDIEKIAQRKGVAPTAIKNFAANVNPLGLSPLATAALKEHMDIMTRYPDRDYGTLRRALASYNHTDHHYILVGNGSTELLSLFIGEVAPKKALILGPTYSEYERELKINNSQFSYYCLAEENQFKLDIPGFLAAIEDDTDLVIICNPNNPTSSALANSELEQILKRAKEQDCWVLVDETYQEFTKASDCINASLLLTQYDNLLITRGGSKFFAVPGLRFGYALCSNKEMRGIMKGEQNPWSLNSVAAFFAEAMVGDTDYIEQTKALVWSEKFRIADALKNNQSFRLYKAYGNFFLLKILKKDLTAKMLFDEALEENMMIRICTGMAGLEGEYIRFGILSPEDNDRLLALLRRHY